MEPRQRMVEQQIAARAVTDPLVLAAMRKVGREPFVGAAQRERAYEDSPLPIEEGQTISQPYIVALMTEALRIGPSSRVLEVGTGSGYAAAVLAEIAAEVFTIERHEALARTAADRLRELGYRNVSVRHGDGTLGWAEQAPFDAIVVAAGGPEVPAALLAQLVVGGRLVIPIGETPRAQSLVRVTRTSATGYEREDLGAVRFVPLIGAQGWKAHSASHGTATLIAEAAERIDDLESAPLEGLLDRIGDADVVLLGEASHGTSEFYRMRARITRELVLRRGFRMVAIEGDWPDAAHVDRHLRDLPPLSERFQPFRRVPTWMWRNLEVQELLHWLHEFNRGVADPAARVRFHGLDLYSMYTSIAAVVDYLDRVDPRAAKVARERYAGLTPWQQDPSAYGRAMLSGRYRDCEEEVVAMLRDLHARRVEYMERDGELFFDAVQNARLIANAERYYRVMYYGSRESWNLRDSHMFDTLGALRAFYPGTKVVVWEHNSHVGDAAARWARAASTTSASSAVRPSATARTVLASEPIAARSPPPTPGTSRCRSCACDLRTPTATSTCATTATCRPSCSRCGTRGAMRCATSSWRRVWSARSGSSTGRIPRSRATTSRPACPSNSTSTSGSTRPRPSGRSTSRCWSRSSRLIRSRRETRRRRDDAAIDGRTDRLTRWQRSCSQFPRA